MSKALSEMTLEELWQLFPILLTKPDPRWSDWYREEASHIAALLDGYDFKGNTAQRTAELPDAPKLHHIGSTADLPDAPKLHRIGSTADLSDAPKLHHIGSTAIAGIWAKPIVDILVEIPVSASMEEIADLLTADGYTRMSESENRISLNKGYTPDGFAERVFHLHLRFSGDIREVYFRDYMNAHPDLAKKYEALKLSLWKRYEHNRDAYTDAKTDFITRCTDAALDAK